MRLALSLFACLTLIRCSCDPPPPPPDGGVIGDGDPIEPPDAGTPRDAGPNICTDDENEENDARVLATVLTSGDSANGTFCGGDDDWYAVESAPGCSVVASVTFDPSGGDIDMLLFDPDGQLVGSAQTLGDSEELNVAATKTGLYAARLRGGARDEVPYSITLLSSCTADLTCPADDRFEDNDSLQQPLTLSEGVAADGILCAPDEDWFNVPVALGCVADARLGFEHDDGDIDLELYRPDGTRQFNANDTQDGERIIKVVVEPGMRYRALLFGAATQNTWRFVVNEICTVACPSDDPFEPNDTRDDANRLQSALDEVLGAHYGANDDFFDLIPEANCELQANLTGDVDMELTTATGTVLASGAQIAFTPANTNRLVLRIFGAESTYRLRVTTVCP